MNHKENMIRAYRRQKPEWIPVASGLPYLDWEKFGYDVDELESVCLRHEILFPGFARGNLRKNHENVPGLFPDMVENRRYTDYWGCVWETKHTGMVGAVVYHPLVDYSALESFKAPDSGKCNGLHIIDWEELERHSGLAKQYDGFFGMGLPHGHTFLRLSDLRGYQNLILDMASEEPGLETLIGVVVDFNMELINRMVPLCPDMISIPEDLGMKNSPMITPGQFRKYIAPGYRRYSRPIKQAGIILHQHSDGFILPLMDAILEAGVDVINLQDLVNGVDNIARELKGRTAIDLDIDRQSVTVTGSPGDIDAHIRECVEKLAAPEGGLSICYQPWPPTPAKNLDAAFTALEKYCVKDYGKGYLY